MMATTMTTNNHKQEKHPFRLLRTEIQLPFKAKIRQIDAKAIRQSMHRFTFWVDTLTTYCFIQSQCIK